VISLLAATFHKCLLPTQSFAFLFFVYFQGTSLNPGRNLEPYKLLSVIRDLRTTGKLTVQEKEDNQFELMLTRRAKTYSSSCSQTVSLTPVISSQFILCVHCSRKSQKSIKKTFYFGSSGSFKVIDVDKKLVTSAYVIGSMPMVICSHLHEGLANNGKIMTFSGVPLFDTLVRRFP